MKYWLCFFTLCWAQYSFAQDPICGVWYTEGKTSAVEIYKTPAGQYHGKIIWIKDGFKNGKPLLDTENPDKIKRNNTWLGLEIITGLVKKTSTEYVSGQIYDPQKGNFYSCKMTVEPGGRLALRGYILGMPFLGRTTIWTLKEERAVPYTPPSITNPAAQP